MILHALQKKLQSEPRLLSSILAKLSTTVKNMVSLWRSNCKPMSHCLCRKERPRMTHSFRRQIGNAMWIHRELQRRSIRVPNAHHGGKRTPRRNLEPATTANSDHATTASSASARRCRPKSQCWNVARHSLPWNETAALEARTCPRRHDSFRDRHPRNRPGLETLARTNFTPASIASPYRDTTTTVAIPRRCQPNPLHLKPECRSHPR